MVCYAKAYWKRVSDRNRLRGKRAQAVMREQRLTRELDADTLRQRALYDRRGATVFVIRRGVDSFEIQHSICGRTDQYDVIHNNCIIATKRLDLILEAIITTIGIAIHDKENYSSPVAF